MKKKGAKVGRLRLSPNEETMLLKEEYERRRKLRLQQVREQQKCIALQIRQKVKQRREEQLHRLEEALRAEWQKAQDEKMKALEELYLSSLRAIGESHRRAKENVPDLEALAKQAEERRQRAEKRHRKALKEQKHQKEKALDEQARRTNARKHALEVERQRAAKVASLPPPPPHPLENVDVKKTLAAKAYNTDTFSVTRYHISGPCVDRELDGEQPDARSAAEEEGKRLEELHREAERGRRERLEKAHLRGSQALKKVHLAQDREKLLKELEQMQTLDRMRRKQIVGQMPRQLFVPAYKHKEMKEDWQRELEFAFEDMCSEHSKVKEDVILQFEPQPLPAPFDRSQDNELDISLESTCDAQPESACDTQQETEQMTEEELPNQSENHKEVKPHQPQSKVALKKLLNKIKSQKEERTSKSEEIQSEMETIESGTIASEERLLCDLEHKDTACGAKDSEKMLENTDAAEKSVPIHPQELSAKIRMEEERQTWYEQIEQQKQQQLALLKQIDEERARLEAEFLKIQMQTCLEKAKKNKEEEEGREVVQNHSAPPADQQDRTKHEPGSTADSGTATPAEDSHVQVIRSYQQRLLQQNRLHRQTIAEARQRLQEYQSKLKQRCVSAAASPLSSVETNPLHVKPVPEPHLQSQRVQLTQYQPAERVHTQEYGRSLPVFAGPLPVLRTASSQTHGEQIQNICPDRQGQFSEASKWKHGEGCVPRGCPSQEQVGTLEASNNYVGELAPFQLPSGLVVKEVTAVRMQPEAGVQHTRFALPAEDSTQASETVHFKESSWKTSNCRVETEAGEDPPLQAPLMAAVRGSRVVQTALVDSLGSAESTIKTSLEQPLSLCESTGLSPEESEAQGVEEFLVSKMGDASLVNYSGILNLRDRVLASSESIQAQQNYLKGLQEQIDAQRAALLSRQKIQEQLLLQRQDKLREQMQRQQEALKELLNKQGRPVSTDEDLADWVNRTDFSQLSATNQQEKCGSSRSPGRDTISRCTGPAEQTEHSETVVCREQKRRCSKPPVTKVKLGFGLRQHELSVIPEVDTPKSCSISTADKTDPAALEASPSSTMGELGYVKRSSHALCEEGRLHWGIPNYKGDISNRSPRQSKQSSQLLQELLLMTAENSYDSGHSQDSQLAQDSPPVAAEVGEGVTAHSGSSCALDDTEVLAPLASPSVSAEDFLQGIPCDLTSTISTGSFVTGETLDVSPTDTGLSSDSTEDGVLSGTASHPWNSARPCRSLQRQGNLSGASGARSPEEEKYHRLQQVLGSTGEFSSHSEENTRFQALPAELDVPEAGRPLPSFHHQVFEPLEPSPDSDNSSTCSQYRRAEGSRESTKTPELTTKGREMSTFLEAGSSALCVRRGSLPSGLETTGLSDRMSEKESVNVPAGPEDSFHPLQSESTLSELCQSADQPVDFGAVLQRSMEQSPGSVSSAREYEELARDVEGIHLQPSLGDVHSESLSVLEEHESFYPLSATPVTVEAALPPPLLKEPVSCELLPLGAGDDKYVKLPETSLSLPEANKAAAVDSQSKGILKEPALGFPEAQKPLRVLRGASLQGSDSHPQSSSLPDRQQKHSHAVPRSCCRIPVWETEAGCGILEEPELTLLSSGDVSAAESDAEHSNRAKMKEDKINHPARVARAEPSAFPEEPGFLPLAPDADCSAFLRPGEGPSKAQHPDNGHLPSHQTAVMLLEFTAPPRGLRESFLKRKKNFIQKSVRRVEEMKNRERGKEKLEARQSQRREAEKSSRQKEPRLASGRRGVVASGLKKVEVKVSSPDSRKPGEAAANQQTSRRPDQLAEGRIRKEETTRQETYAKNREKAKEFEKKMLEKLRAKKTWKAA